MPPASFRRLLAWSFGPCIPAWIVLAGLVVFAGLDRIAALVGGGIVFALMAILVFTRLADFDRLIRSPTIRPSGPAVTCTVEPSITSPASSISASGSCRLRWITRLSGRAPNTGS